MSDQDIAPVKGSQWALLPTLIIAAFFVIIIIADFGYIYMAKHSYSGTVTENSYQKGLDYNDVIAAAKRQQQLNWQDQLDFIGKYEIGTLRFCLRDSAGQPIKATAVRAQLRHPVTHKYDQELQFISQDGCYTTEVKLSRAGQWEVMMHAQVGDIDYYQRHTLLVE